MPTVSSVTAGRIAPDDRACLHGWLTVLHLAATEAGRFLVELDAKAGGGAEGPTEAETYATEIAELRSRVTVLRHRLDAKALGATLGGTHERPDYKSRAANDT